MSEAEKSKTGTAEPKIEMYTMDIEEQNAILNILLMIREELGPILPPEEVAELDSSPYAVAMAAWKFIQNAKKMREQDLATPDVETLDAQAIAADAKELTEADTE